MLDISYNFRNDSLSGDPDRDSRKLYEMHQWLWHKPLPNGSNLDLKIKRIGGTYGRLLLHTATGDDLSSDRMCPHFIGTHKNKYHNWLPLVEQQMLHHIVRTIGGHIIFPAHKKDGLTINQARGINSKIGDRFDLTLECIRLFYLENNSPLFTTLKRYDSFFKLFVNFENYISFFHLQDWLDENKNIRFALPFQSFEQKAIPQTPDEYMIYQSSVVAIIQNRNKRLQLLSQ